MKHYHWTSLVMFLVTGVSCLAGGPGCCVSRCCPPGYGYGVNCATGHCGGAACGSDGNCAAATCGGGWRGPEFFVDEYGRPCYGPVIGLISLFRDALMSCGGGPVYVDEWISDPPECHDPCCEQLPTPACSGCGPGGEISAPGACDCGFHSYPERAYGWTSRSLDSPDHRTASPSHRISDDRRSYDSEPRESMRPLSSTGSRPALRRTEGTARSRHVAASHSTGPAPDRRRPASQATATRRPDQAPARLPHSPTRPREEYANESDADPPLVLRAADASYPGDSAPPRRFTPPKKPSPVRSAGWWN